MKKRSYRVLGMIVALTVVISNVQITNVFAEESRQAVESGQALAGEEQTSSGNVSGQETEDGNDQTGGVTGTGSADQNVPDDTTDPNAPDAEENQDNQGEGVSGTDPSVDNENQVSGETEAVTDQDVQLETDGEEAEETVEEQGQSWEDANSWRYQNGELVSVQTYSRFSEFTTWPDVDGVVARGIDVSQFQGTIDWEKVKAAGVEFAIIRCGYGDDSSSQDDPQWARNVSECERLGIPYGVYIYSYAMSTEAAQSEAEHVLRLLEGHNPTYPVYLDMENEGGSYDQGGLDPKTLGDIAETFCNIVSNAGYEVGIYANTNWFTNKLTDSRFNQWTRWVAQYNTECTYTGSYTMWQCSSKGKIDGISGNVDLNLDFGTVETAPDTSEAEIVYQAHVQDIGWQLERVDGGTAGTTGRSLRVEALKISKGGALQGISGDIKYRAHVQDIGNQDWVYSSTDEIAGTTGKSKRVEAIQIALTDELARQYNIYYRVHVQNLGWMNWIKGSEEESSWTGTNGLGLEIEAIEIQMVKKGEQAPSSSAVYSYITEPDAGTLSYLGHQQDYGNLSSVSEGNALGITGKSKRMEALQISLNGASLDGTIQYRAHVQDIGWQSWKNAGQLAGTTGESKRLEAIQIQLTGGLSTVCDVWYRVHVQNYGWLGWAKNGQTAGTTGISYRIESIQIQIVPKGKAAPGSNSGYYKTTRA